MATMIRISPSALRAAAERHMTVTAAVDEATAKLSNLVNELNAAWDGGASNDALREMRQIREDIADVGQGTSGHAEKLQRIAEAFEALDGSGTPTIMPMAFSEKIANLIIGPGAINPFNWFLHNTLRIVPDEVRNVAAQCRHISNELMETAAKLNADVDSLASEWEGRAYDRFAADSRNMINAFKNCASRLSEFADTITKAADRYEELDNSLA